MYPLRGNYFLDTTIHRSADYSADTFGGAVGLGNSGDNKPRIVLAIGSSAGRFLSGDEEWFSFSIYLPENHVHETNYTSTVARNQLFVLQDDPSITSNNAIEFSVEHRSSGHDYDSWYVQISTQANYETPTTEDLGKWTTWLFRFRDSSSNGILQIWKSVGDYITGYQRRMQQVVDYTNTNIGVHSQAYIYWPRQYKFAWHHQQNMTETPEIFIGWDEIRLGGENEGTGFQDVHPFQHTQSQAENL